jgi:hypothetical protein
MAAKLRWLALLVVCGLGLLLVVARRSVRLPDARLYWLIGTFGVLAVASSAWSVNPRLSFERGASFVVLLVAASALGVGLAGDARGIDGVLGTIVAAAVSVSVAGAVLFAVAPNDAVQWGTAATPLRFQGLGQNPNTVAMLAAVAAPLAMRYVLAPAVLGRRLGVMALAVLYATVVASGSRGALLALFAGLLLVALLLHGHWRHRLVTSVAVLGLLFGGVFVNDALLRGVQGPPEPPAIAAPASTLPPTASPGGTATASAGGSTTNQLPRMEDEIGSANAAADAQVRRLFGASGRAAAWRGAFTQAEKRPVLGFGFGTEDRVFTDRFYAFEGSRPENSYLGLFLELGAVGVAVFVGIGVALLLVLVRGERAGRATTVAAAGGVLAGYALGVGQSYVYSVGNVATVSFWMCALMLAAAASAPVSGSVMRSDGVAVNG